MHDATEIVFTNHGTAHCSLSGFPDTVMLFDAAGRRVTEYSIKLADGGYVTTFANGGVDLAPQTSDGAPQADAVAGQAVVVVKTDALMCGRTSVASVEIVLHGGASFRVPVAFAPDTNPDCLSGSPVEVSSFQPPGHGPPVDLVPSPVISVQITAPATAVPGTILDYTVALTNVSGHALELEPCPAYTEGLKVLQHAERHLLNCAAVPSLAPGETRVFAMQISVPSVPPGTPAASGEDFLSWGLDPPLVSTEVGGPALVTDR